MIVVTIEGGKTHKVDLRMTRYRECGCEITSIETKCGVWVDDTLPDDVSGPKPGLSCKRCFHNVHT